MNTPLMELIEYCEKQMANLNQQNTVENVARVTFYDVIAHIKATELLEKERATIEQSWEQGCLTGEGIGEMITNGSDYYTKTFNNESK